MACVASRIVNNVSCVQRFDHESHFARQAQYLVKWQCHFLVAGAVFGEIWKDSRSAKCFIFPFKMLAVSVKSNLGCEAGCGLTVSWSDHCRIIFGSVAQWSVSVISLFIS